MRRQIEPLPCSLATGIRITLATVADSRMRTFRPLSPARTGCGTNSRVARKSGRRDGRGRSKPCAVWSSSCRWRRLGMK
jgi:hypothetical protein